jgi:surface protein
MKTFFNSIIFIYSIYQILGTIKSNIKFQINTNDILIKIKGNNINFHHRICSDEVYYINGTKIEIDSCELQIDNDINTLIFKNYKNINLDTLFLGSTDILEVIFINFTLTDMVGTFDGCTSLTSIDFFNVNALQIRDMYRAFYNCISLKSIDLSKLDLSSAYRFQRMFHGCESLEYINFINYNESQVKHNINEYYLIIDDVVPANLVICINEEIAPRLFSSLINRTCTLIYCGEDWRKKRKKIINGTRDTCVDSCITTESIYEFEGKCYKECPNGTISNNNMICEIIDNSVEIITENLFIESTTEKIMETELKTEVNHIENLINNFISEANNITREEMVDNLINAIESGSFKEYLLKSNKTEIIAETNNEIYQISTFSSQLDGNNNNISTIHLGKCEDQLKLSNNINLTEELIIFKIAHLMPELKTQLLEYSFFSIEGNQLNMDSCNNLTIKYDVPVDINESELYKYDPNSDFYNDICNQYTSDTGTDMSNYDRKNEFNDKNMALCENNCEFIEYKKEIKKVVCDCKIKNSFNNFDKLQKDELIKKISNYKNVLNLEIIKCFHLLLSKKGLISNIGNYITLCIIFIYIILSIIFCLKGYNSFLNRIEKLTKSNSKKIKSKKKESKKIKIINHQKENAEQNEGIKIEKSFPPKKKNLSIKLKGKSKKRKSEPSQIESTKRRIKTNIETKINYIDDKFKNTERNDYEMNTLSYEDALKYDNRTFCQYYLSLVRLNHLVVFTFYTKTDYNSRIIKLCSFCTYFCLNYTIKALFFNDSMMHVIYVNKGVYDIIFQLPQIIYSSIISGIIRMILSFLSLTQTNVLEIKKLGNKLNNNDNKYKQLMTNIRNKFIFFFVVNYILLFAFWFYLSSFCAVYKNTQIYLIKDVLISFGISLIYPFLIYILPSIFRIISLNSKKDKKIYLYSFSKLLQII